MPRAISRSPMMVKFAPHFLRYSTSASEWARATMSRFILDARDCSTARAGNVCGLQQAGLSGIPGYHLDSALLQLRHHRLLLFNDEVRLPRTFQGLRDQAPYSSVTDEHGVARKTSEGSRRRLGHGQRDIRL